MATGLAQEWDTARDDAEHWFVRLRAEDCSAQERVAFERWLAADASHAVAYSDVQRVWQASVDLLQDPALAGARAEAHRRPAPVRTSARRWRPLGWAAAAVVVIGVGVGTFLLREAPVPAVPYATGIGEQRTLQLEDRSVVRLDTDTAIDVRYGRGERRVILSRGRAEFGVAHDTGQPFIVETAEGSVQALGTRFQVRQETDTATVLLLEGSVAVSTAGAGDAPIKRDILVPGEELRFDAGGNQWRKRVTDLAFAQGWTQGNLIFDGRPLSELLAEANRYTPAQLRLADPTLGDIRISGVFHANDQPGLLQALQHGWQLRAARVSDREIVLSR